MSQLQLDREESSTLRRPRRLGWVGGSLLGHAIVLVLVLTIRFTRDPVLAARFRETVTLLAPVVERPKSLDVAVAVSPPKPFEETLSQPSSDLVAPREFRAPVPVNPERPKPSLATPAVVPAEPDLNLELKIPVASIPAADAALAVRPTPAPPKEIKIGNLTPQNIAAQSDQPSRTLDLSGQFGSSRGTTEARTTGTVSRAGFGSTEVSTAGSSRPSGGAQKSGSFGASRVASAGKQERTVSAAGFAKAQTGEVQRAAAEPVSVRHPVEILSKPKPVYSEEARGLGIEGEVVLRVAFLASGSVRVLRVVEGLGHGLDEAATAAAGKIQFRPAEENGSPIDSEATIRIVFQLAY